jgi:LmbE family N-acetylglucosaminyl deacetylase
VWTPLYPNRIVDISGVVEIKKRAIGAHHSQVSVIDYVEKIIGLNSFRSMTAKGVRFAEAFYKCSPRTYIEMVRTLTD